MFISSISKESWDKIGCTSLVLHKNAVFSSHVLSISLPNAKILIVSGLNKKNLIIHKILYQYLINLYRKIEFSKLKIEFYLLNNNDSL